MLLTFYSIFESFINNNIAFIKQFVLNVWSMNRYFYYYIYSLVFTFSLSFAKMNRKKGNHCSIVMQFLYSCCVYYCKNQLFYCDLGIQEVLVITFQKIYFTLAPANFYSFVRKGDIND